MTDIDHIRRQPKARRRIVAAAILLLLSITALASCGSSKPTTAASTPDDATNDSATSTTSTTTSTTASAAKTAARRSAATRRRKRSARAIVSKPSTREHVVKLALAVSTPGVASGSDLPRSNTCDGKDLSPAIRWSKMPRGTAEVAVFVLNLQTVDNRLFVDWAVHGLGPSTDGIPEGRVPTDAAVAANSFGRTDYSVCPSKGRTESYVVKVFALPRKLSSDSKSSALTLYREAEKQATVAGVTGVNYTRSS